MADVHIHLKSGLSFSRSDRQKLTELLLDCNSMARQETREIIVLDLPPELREGLVRDHQQRKVEIRQIVEGCLNHPGGLEELRRNLKFYEGNTEAFKKVEQFLDA